MFISDVALRRLIAESLESGNEQTTNDISVIDIAIELLEIEKDIHTYDDLSDDGHFYLDMIEKIAKPDDYEKFMLWLKDARWQQHMNQSLLLFIEVTLFNVSIGIGKQNDAQFEKINELLKSVKEEFNTTRNAKAIYEYLSKIVLILNTLYDKEIFASEVSMLWTSMYVKCKEMREVFELNNRDDWIFIINAIYKAFIKNVNLMRKVQSYMRRHK